MVGGWWWGMEISIHTIVTSKNVNSFLFPQLFITNTVCSALARGAVVTMAFYSSSFRELFISLVFEHLQISQLVQSRLYGHRALAHLGMFSRQVSVRPSIPAQWHFLLKEFVHLW